MAKDHPYLKHHVIGFNQLMELMGWNVPDQKKRLSYVNKLQQLISHFEENGELNPIRPSKRMHRLFKVSELRECFKFD